MRNDAVPTVVSSVRDVRLADKAADLLAQKRFAIVPDPEHMRRLAELQPGHPAVARIREMAERPPPVAVLTGTDTGPDIRFDRPFMSARGTDPAASAALEELSAQLAAAQQDVTAGPGSLLVVDNRRAVHGRRPFRARYDGTDRWLKKILVRGALDPAAAGPGSSPRVLL